MHGWYPRYVLAVLVIVYIFNILDRQIFAILAEAIKKDLALSDADLGFLGGAAFAVFYAVFGIPLARLADVWNRKKLISVGLGFWSLMTALSGLARSLLSLAACRFGVGVGEASASPAAYSMLYDYFSPKVRATVVAIYGTGLYIGAGLGLFLGGMVLDAWSSAFPETSTAPFGLKGWQAAFMIVGFPGVLMALWVSTLKEPVRGASDGISSQPHPHPFRESVLVLISLLPISNLWVLVREGGDRAMLMRNLFAGLVIAFICYGLVVATGNVLQWVTLGIGFYAVVSWSQSLALRDAVAYGMLFRCKALLYTILGQVGPNFTGVAISLWSVPFLQRFYGASPFGIGSVLGLGFVVMGFSGALLGGLLADKLRAYTVRGKLYVLLASMVLSALSTAFFLTAGNLVLAYTGIYLMYFTGAMGFGPAASTINDLVLPRNRATVSAFNLLIITLLAYALGPYIIGLVSDAITATGIEGGEALRRSMLWSLLFAMAGSVFVLLALKHIESDENSLKARARELGERIE